MKYTDFYKPLTEYVKEKSTTTHADYARIAEKMISYLMVMAKKNPKTFTAAEKDITPSVIKSILIGLGQSHPDLSKKLSEWGSIARKPKIG